MDLEFSPPRLFSARVLAAGWYMASRVIATALVPGGILAIVLLSSSLASLVSPRVLALYVGAATASGIVLATSHFARRWTEQQYKRGLPGPVWWSVTWPAGLLAGTLVGLGGTIFAAHPPGGALALAALTAFGLAGFLGILLVFGWSTIRAVQRRIREAEGNWAEDAEERPDEARRPAAASGAARPRITAPGPAVARSAPSGVRANPAPIAAPPAGGGAPSRPSPVAEPGARRAPGLPPRPAHARPIPAPEPVFQATFWQNVLGGWEVGIFLGPPGEETPASRGLLVFRSDRRPRPLGSPPGGFSSRALAEQFVRAKIAEAREILLLNQRLRRAPRFRIPGGLRGRLEPAGWIEIQDLSLEGICAEHEAPLAPGQQVRLAVDLPGGRCSISAKVIWSAASPASSSAARRASPFRSGLRFLTVRPEDLANLQSFLAAG